jgi:diguanylate cyclase (GGDEF)-like protein
MRSNIRTSRCRAPVTTIDPAKELLVRLASWVRERFADVTTWPVWTLPRWLTALIVVVVVADVAMLAAALSSLSIRAHDLELFAALLGCSAATVELTRRSSENKGFAKDVYAVWELPVAILLPLAFVPIIPAVRTALTQWRVRRAPLYRRVFTSAAIGLSYFAAGLTFRLLARILQASMDKLTAHALAWMLTVAACAAVQWAVNQTLVLTAVKGSDPSVKLRDVQFSREPMFNDVTELCVAVLVTFCVANNMIALAFAFPFVSLLQRSFRHAQLVKDSRADSKTGLLNAATWEREATAEVVRAVRTRTSMAIALLDIDKFKVINDTYGHLVGDQVIKEIARTLDGRLLREYDLAGRFGGEEFALLLPQTRAVDAFRIAERVRANIAGLSIIAPGTTGGERVYVTVSIGVAALDSGSKREYAELMATADAALYRAKAGGRDQVQMISTTRGLSAISGGGRGASGASGGRADVPSAFRRAQNS